MIIAAFVGDMSNYPLVTKTINSQYYFSQQEYGMAWTMPGKDLIVYKKRKFWFDKTLAKIRLMIVTEDLDAQIKQTNNPESFELVVTGKVSHTVLDTVLNSGKSYDFAYFRPMHESN